MLFAMASMSTDAKRVKVERICEMTGTTGSQQSISGRQKVEIREEMRDDAAGQQEAQNEGHASDEFMEPTENEDVTPAQNLLEMIINYLSATGLPPALGKVGMKALNCLSTKLKIPMDKRMHFNIVKREFLQWLQTERFIPSAIVGDASLVEKFENLRKAMRALIQNQPQMTQFPAPRKRPHSFGGSVLARVLSTPAGRLETSQPASANELTLLRLQNDMLQKKNQALQEALDSEIEAKIKAETSFAEMRIQFECYKIANAPVPKPIAQLVRPIKLELQPAEDSSTAFNTLKIKEQQAQRRILELEGSLRKSEEMIRDCFEQSLNKDKELSKLKKEVQYLKSTAPNKMEVIEID